MGFGAKPRLCLLRPTDRPTEETTKSPLSRAEYAGRCAVKSPMCDDEPKRSGGFGGALWLPLFKIVGKPTTARQNRASNSL